MRDRRLTIAAGALAVVAAIGTGLVLRSLVLAALAAVTVAVVPLMVRNLAPAAAWTLGVVALPLFFDVADRSLSLLGLLGVGGPGRVIPGSTRLPLSAAAVAALVLAVVLVRPRGQHPPGTRIVVGLLAWFSLSLGYGLVIGRHSSSVVFYGQAVVPLLAFLATAHARPRSRSMTRAFLGAVLFTVLVTLAYALTHGMLGSAYTTSLAIEAAIPQYRSYFPVLMATAVALAVTHLTRQRALSVAVLLGVTVAVPFTWSRGGLSMIGVAGVAAFLMAPWRIRLRRRVAVLAGLAVLAAYPVYRLVGGGILAQREALSNLSASDSNRIVLAREALDHILANPLVGDAFRPYSAVLQGGAQADFARLFPSHNQYLDYGIRGGLVAIGLLLALLVVVTGRALALRRHPDPDTAAFASGMLAALVAVVLGSLGELYFSQPWSGSAILMLLATVVAQPVGPPLTGGSPPTGDVVGPSTG